MAKKKASSKKKPAAKKAAKHAAPKKSAKKKAAPKRAASKRPALRKKTVPRAHVRPTPPLPSGSEQPVQLAGGNGEEDEHGPMHIPSHKPAPAYAEMHKRDWANKPPQHNIPIPKR
jgi:hypothetical protein